MRGSNGNVEKIGKGCVMVHQKEDPQTRNRSNEDPHPPARRWLQKFNMANTKNSEPLSGRVRVYVREVGGGSVEEPQGGGGGKGRAFLNAPCRGGVTENLLTWRKLLC